MISTHLARKELVKELETLRQRVAELEAPQAERKPVDEEQEKREDALHRSEAKKYKDLYENAPVAYYSVGTDGSIKEFNKAIQLWLDFSADELRHMSVFDIYAEESRARVKVLLDRLRQGIATDNEELVYRKKNGENAYGLLTLSVVRDDSGQVVASRSVVKDITEYKQTEAALRESAENYHSLLKNMINGYAFCKILVNEENKPVDFLYIDINDAFEKLTGLKKEDVIGKKVTETIPSIKASNPEIIPIYGEVAATGRPTAFEIFFKPLDIWLAISVYSPRKDYFVAVFNNITEHKRAEEVLRESRERYKLLAEYSADVIYGLNIKDECYTYVSPAVERIFGYTDREALSLQPKDMLTAESYKKQKREMFKDLEVGKTYRTLQLEAVHKDGHIIPVEVHAHLVNDDNGQPVEIVGVVRDITERKLAEQMYHTLADSSPAGVYIVQSRKVVFTNPAFQKATGFTADELLGTEPSIIVHPEDRRGVRRNAVQMLKGERLQPYEFRVMTKSGRIMWSLERTTSITYNGRRATLGNFMDITERKQTEKALQESEEKYRGIIDQSLDGIMITDENGNIITWNKAMELITGINRCQAIGFPVWQVQSQLIPDELKTPELLAQLGTEYRKILESKIDWPGESRDQEIISADGTRKVVQDSSFTIKTNNTVRLGAIMRDVTERKKMEEKIKGAAEEWRRTFDSITELVSIVDRDFKLVRVNKAFADAFGARPQELIGKHCYEVVHKTNEPPPNCPHNRTLQSRKPATAEFLEPCLGVYLEVTTSPMFDANGKAIGSVHVARDINERRRMQEQLMLTDRLASIGELASGVAHELNNPLTSVIGFSQLLLEREIPDDIKEDLSLVCSEAQRAASVIKNLLTFARKHVPAKQLCQIHNIIEDVLKLRAYEQTVSNITVDRRFAADLPEITVDYFQMQQVFLNLIVNAEFFMAEAHRKGTITITTKRLNNTVRISFADDGLGIPKENLSRLFDPFFTTKEVGKGTGLGLSICHGIVSEHGGSIYARSQLGKGATFVVELPVTNGH